jgi:hypothetical protein
MDWSPNYEYLATKGPDGIIKVYDASPIQQLPGNLLHMVLAMASFLALLPSSCRRPSPTMTP